ncbi:MAG: SDR family NAD(P)-dependent oxidoreductase [Haloferacaceae archaeon]
MSLVGQTAIVTGAGRGIGRAISLELAEQGADIVAADIDSDGMAETKAQVEERGRSALTVKMDLRDHDEVQGAVSQALEEFGSIEILVNNAGISGPTLSCDEMPVEDWDDTLSINLRGAFLMCREVIPSMKEQEYGRVVNIASVSGKRPVPNRTPYAASKMGMIGLTRSLAAEVGEYDINVNAVCPGSVEGPRIERVFDRFAEARGTTSEEVKRGELNKSARRELVRPESVAKSVAMLCSEASDQMTGQDLNVSAGKVMY